MPADLIQGQLLQIHWHSKLPVFSLDLFSDQNTLRLATGGADSRIRIWELLDNQVNFISTLSKHLKAVNCVQWQPLEENPLLCSGGDGGSLFLWHKVANDEPVEEPNAFAEDDEDAAISKERWKVKTCLECGSPFDVYACAWIPNGRFVAAGATDHTARIYNVALGTCIRLIRDHGHFVNGIAWDFSGKLLASISADGAAKICTFSANSTVAPLGKIQRNPTSNMRLFQDEEMVSFFRKAAFRPDDAFLYVPSGILPSNGAFCVHAFQRNALQLGLPTFSIGPFPKGTVGVFFCKQKFVFVANGGAAFLVAVLTQDSIYVLETATHSTLFTGFGYHYGTLTDAAWNSAGSLLLVSSCDGFISSFTCNWGGILRPVDTPIAVPEPKEQIVVPKRRIVPTLVSCSL